MPVTVAPRVTVSLALVGASVLSVAPIAVVLREETPAATSQAVNLTAAGSLINVPVNILNAVLNAPSAHLAGVQRLTAAMEMSKSWWVYSPVNVLGWDPANPEMVKGLVDAVIPFPAFSTSAGEHLNWWMAANLPMYAGCSGFPPCDDPFGILDHMFKVPSWQFYTTGYTFSEPLTPERNPVSELDGEWGQALPDQVGDPVPWYGEYVKLDPWEGLNSVLNYLTNDPGPVTIPTLQQVVTTYANFAKSLWNSWYPFVPQSVLWNPAYSISAYITRPFAKILCPNCNPYDPFMPVDWKPGDPIPPGGYVPPGYVPPDTAATPAPAATVAVDVVSNTTTAAPAQDTAQQSAEPAAAPAVGAVRGNDAATGATAGRRAAAAAAAEDSAPAQPAAASPVGAEPADDSRAAGTATATPAAGPASDADDSAVNNTAPAAPGTKPADSPRQDTRAPRQGRTGESSGRTAK